MQPWQRALVTGASSGIGEAFADRLASQKVDLILVGRDLAALEKVASGVRSRGARADVLRLDLSVESDVTAAVAVIREASPMVDLLVNNAGLGQHGSFVDLPLDAAIETMRVNNEALVRLTHAAAARMVEAGHGSIIQISSTSSASPGPWQAVYAATKAFVTSFGQALSSELEGTAVTCTTVLPGYTRTGYFARIGLTPQVPERRWMTAHEVARISLDAARMGRTLSIPGFRNRWRVSLTSQFPGSVKGRAERRLNRLYQHARSVKARLAGRHEV